MEFWQLLHCCKMVCSQLIHKWRATSNIRYMLTQARAYYFTIKMSRKSSCSYDWLCFSYVGSRKSSNFDSQTENQNIQKKWMKGMPCISTQNSLLAMHILMGDFEWLNFPAVAHVILFCFWVYIKTNIIIMCLIHSLLVKFWPPLREY